MENHHFFLGKSTTNGNFQLNVSLPEGQNPGKNWVFRCEEFSKKKIGPSAGRCSWRVQTSSREATLESSPRRSALPWAGRLFGWPKTTMVWCWEFHLENSAKFTPNSDSPTFHSSPSHISQLNCQIFLLSLVDPFSKRLPVIFLGRDWQLPQERHLCGVPDDTIWTSWMISMMIITGWWWLEPWNFMTFHWAFHNPNWRSPSFFRGVGIPPTRLWIPKLVLLLMFFFGDDHNPWAGSNTIWIYNDWCVLFFGGQGASIWEPVNFVM